MRVTFTVRGATNKELEERAVEVLERFSSPARVESEVMPGKMVRSYSFYIEAEPVQLGGDGRPSLWEGEVTAEVSSDE